MSVMMITKPAVLQHLMQMKHIYDTTIVMDPLKIYDFFLNEESQYKVNNVYNFATTVHQLHPVIYQSDTYDILKILFITIFRLINYFNIIISILNTVGVTKVGLKFLISLLSCSVPIVLPHFL
jgi:hypothetical protein